MPKKTIHYAADINAACGMATGRYAELSTIGHMVNCKACKRSVMFKRHHPELAIASTGGRPKGQGVQRTFKVWLSPELNEWLNAQGVVADTIVRSLTELRRRSEDEF
jgi:hypothetical protein